MAIKIYINKAFIIAEDVISRERFFSVKKEDVIHLRSPDDTFAFFQAGLLPRLDGQPQWLQLGMQSSYAWDATELESDGKTGFDFTEIVKEDGITPYADADTLDQFLKDNLGFFDNPDTLSIDDSVQVAGRNPNVGLVFEDVWGVGSLSTIDYDAQTGNFTAGLVITGADSGATATIVIDDDNGSDGVLTVRDIKGLFIDDEVITDTSTGSADVDGTATKILFRDDPILGVGEQWEAICESALDDSGGTGALTIITSYLDDSFEPQTEANDLNGHTAVLFSATDSYRHKQTSVLTFGALSNGVYGKTNQGVIVIRDTVTKKIRSIIGIDEKVPGDKHGFNNSLDMFYTVPLDTIGIPMKININTSIDNHSTARALVRFNGSEAWNTLSENAVYQNTFSDDFSIAPAGLPVGADVKLIARSENEGTMLNVELFLKERKI